jgi:hypothetical protein
LLLQRKKVLHGKTHMKCNFQKINNSKGIGLLEVMVSIGLLGGVAVLVMNLGKQGSDIQSRSLSGKDEVEMLSVTRTILSQAKNCAESLKLGVARTPIQVKKINNDQADNGEGIETEIFQTDYNGNPHKVLSKVGTESSFGKVNITSIKLVLNNGVGFNYPASSLHSDTGIIRISYTVPRGTKKLDKRSDFIINLSMKTNGSENTTMLNCSKDSGLFTSKATTGIRCFIMIARAKKHFVVNKAIIIMTKKTGGIVLNVATSKWITKSLIENLVHRQDK